MGVSIMFLVSRLVEMNTMNFFKVTLFFTCVVTFFGGIYCEGCGNDLTSKSAAVRLSNDLFCSYNKNVRPVKNHLTKITVNSTIYIFNVYLDEEWDVLQISIQLIMTWTDEFLVWDSAKYENIDRVFEDSATIWVPDIISYNKGFNGDSQDTSYFLPRSKVKINKKGVVRYNHRVVLTAQCSANLAKWPFDSHNCTFLIGSPVYTNNAVNFTFSSFAIDDIFTFYNLGREWKVGSIEHKCLNIFEDKLNSSYQHCVIQFELNIIRFSSMYYSSVIIPAIVISLMRTFTFLMGRETSLRIILLCLFFISELLYLQFLDAKIPNNGENAVYIVLLCRNSLILTALALVISVISNELYKHGMKDFPHNSPEWLKSILTFLMNKIPSTLLTSNKQGAEYLIEKNVEEDTINSQRDENALFWKNLSIILDRLSFVITLLISLVNFWVFIP